MIIAVDPGANGALAIYDEPSRRVTAVNTPATRGDAIELLSRLATPLPNHDVLYVEKINGFIAAAGAGQMFQFGVQVERIPCIAQTLGFRIVEVPPQKWQKALGLGNIGTVRAPANADAEARAKIRQANAATKRDWKNKLKAEAQRRFPGIRVTLHNADAVLLLEYALMVEKQTLHTTVPTTVSPSSVSADRPSSPPPKSGPDGDTVVGTQQWLG